MTQLLACTPPRRGVVSVTPEGKLLVCNGQSRWEELKVSCGVGPVKMPQVSMGGFGLGIAFGLLIALGFVLALRPSRLLRLR